jgi:hypothetical protein
VNRAVNASRRSLLKKGLLGGAILVGGGSLSLLARSGRMGYEPRSTLAVLTPYEYAIFSAAAARLCPGDGAVGWPAAEALDAAGRLDTLLSELHPRAIKDFRRLLHVFESALTGLVSAAAPRTFTRSAPAEQDQRLDAWRRSNVALFRSGYQAMKRLAHAIYYASPEIYQRLGYPGPPTVPQGPA